jgi:hypothetical protein
MLPHKSTFTVGAFSDVSKLLLDLRDLVPTAVVVVIAGIISIPREEDKGYQISCQTCRSVTVELHF